MGWMNYGLQYGNYSGLDSSGAKQPMVDDQGGGAGGGGPMGGGGGGGEDGGGDHKHTPAATGGSPYGAQYGNFGNNFVNLQAYLAANPSFNAANERPPAGAGSFGALQPYGGFTQGMAGLENSLASAPPAPGAPAASGGGGSGHILVGPGGPHAGSGNAQPVGSLTQRKNNFSLLGY